MNNPAPHKISTSCGAQARTGRKNRNLWTQIRGNRQHHCNVVEFGEHRRSASLLGVSRNNCPCDRDNVCRPIRGAYLSTQTIRWSLYAGEDSLLCETDGKLERG